VHISISKLIFIIFKIIQFLNFTINNKFYFIIKFIFKTFFIAFINFKLIFKIYFMHILFTFMFFIFNIKFLDFLKIYLSFLITNLFKILLIILVF